MASTRGQIERDVALLLGEDLSSPGRGEPMWLRRCVVSAADHVARVSECFQTHFTLDIDGSPTVQSVFCAPRELFKLDRVVVTLGNSTKVVLRAEAGQIVTPGRADEIYPTWQTNPASGSQPYICIDRRPDYILYPYPNWDAVAGADFYGWATVGDWAGTGIEAATDEFPLPEYARMAVVYQAAYLRALQLIGAPGNADRLRFLKAEAEDQIGLLARDAATAHGRFS